MSGRTQDIAPPVDPFSPIAASGTKDEPSGPWKFAHDRDSGRVAILTRVGEANGLRDKPGVELSMLPMRNAQQPVKCVVDLCTGKAITEIQWRPSSDEVIFTVTDPHEGLAQSIYRWNVRSGLVWPIVQTRGLIGGGGRWTPGTCGLSATAMACVVTEPGQPPRLEAIDLEAGYRRVLYDPNASLEKDIAHSVPIRLLRWKGREGTEFTGQFIQARQTDGAPAPLFVTYYRCWGFLRGGIGDEWPLIALAEQGISVLCINAAPYRIDAIERYNLGLSAVESAIDLLASTGEIDREKVGMGAKLRDGSYVLDDHELRHCCRSVRKLADVFAAVLLAWQHEGRCLCHWIARVLAGWRSWRNA